jgi:hypothetical protein
MDLRVQSVFHSNKNEPDQHHRDQIATRDDGL